MKRIVVKVNEQIVVEYNYELFEEHIDDITLKVMSKVNATFASEELIVLKDYSDLPKLNDLMISYLI